MQTDTSHSVIPGELTLKFSDVRGDWVTELQEPIAQK